MPMTVTETVIEMNLARVAAHLRHLYQTAKNADRGERRRNQAETESWARLRGACSALHAAGLGMTPAGIETAVHEGYVATFDEHGARPEPTATSATRMAALRDWDAVCAASIADRLARL